MKDLSEKVLVDNWRSFKVFLPLGHMRLHTKAYHLQLVFNPGGKLTIRLYQNGNPKTLAQDAPWSLEVKEGRHYLTVLQAKLHYELVTVNHTVMVIRDVATGEKTFLAREACWNDFLSAREKVM